MAKATRVNSDQSNSYELDQSNHTWIFGEGYYLDGADYPIHQASTFSNDTIIVNARVYVSTNNSIGISFEGSNSKITVSELGQVTGDSGMVANGGGMNIENDGTVVALAVGAGISVTGANAHIVNNGSVTGFAGMFMDSDDGVFVNNGHVYGFFVGLDFSGNNLSITLGKDSVVTSTTTGVAVASNSGETSKVTNSGLIGMAGQAAFASEDGNETFINHGTVRGNVTLGAGNDVFNNLDGKCVGTVDGGLGDDTYIVNSAKTVIVDANDSGNDTIKSIVSFSLAGPTLIDGQIENLVLLGTKNLHGTGNALGNEMSGNAGDNVLDAGGGMDQLKGGKGADIFIFATGHETDSITDFGNGADKIDLSGCADIPGFKDLLKNHVMEDKGNVYIDSGMTEELILDNHSKADLHASDFIF